MGMSSIDTISISMNASRVRLATLVNKLINTKHGNSIDNGSFDVEASRAHLERCFAASQELVIA